MPELIAKANQAILEAQWLRRQQHALRAEANALVSRLGETIVRSHRFENELLRTILDLSTDDPEPSAGAPPGDSAE